MNKNLREKIANKRSETKENKENTENEGVLFHKINHLKKKIDDLIKKKIFQNQNKQKIQQETKKKQQRPMYIIFKKIHCYKLKQKSRNFMKEAHCKNCSKLLSNGIPTNFCTFHRDYIKKMY